MKKQINNRLDYLFLKLYSEEGLSPEEYNEYSVLTIAAAIAEGNITRLNKDPEDKSRLLVKVYKPETREHVMLSTSLEEYRVIFKQTTGFNCFF